jgi:hypothetical protein
VEMGSVVEEMVGDELKVMIDSLPYVDPEFSIPGSCSQFATSEIFLSIFIECAWVYSLDHLVNNGLYM